MIFNYLLTKSDMILLLLSVPAGTVDPGGEGEDPAGGAATGKNRQARRLSHPSVSAVHESVSVAVAVIDSQMQLPGDTSPR